MATSRSLRRSRMPSPINISMQEAVARKNDIHVARNSNIFSAEWEEPPLRTPAPSFEDYKGLERHGVLEHMQPLGTLPNQKVKLRLKAHDPPRRLANPRTAEVAAAAVTMRDEVGTLDPVPPPTARRSESQKAEDKPLKVAPIKERDEDSEYTPKGIPKTTPSKSISSQASYRSTPSSRTPAGQAKLKQVVDSAVKRSYELNNPDLGLAVKRLYEESSQNPSLADLLDAVLSQNPTKQQTAEFQKAIKVARKLIKAEKRSSMHSTPARGSIADSMSLSPSRTTKKVVLRQKENGSSHNVQSVDSSNHVNDGVSKRSLKHRPNNLPKSAPSSGQKPHRTKRSNSTSSLSSVSTLSSIDQDAALKNENDLVHTSAVQPSTLEMPVTRSKPKPTDGPKMGTFSSSNSMYASNKRPLATLEFSKEDYEAAAKRRKLKERQDFSDYTVNDSDVRTLVQDHPDMSLPNLPPPVLERLSPDLNEFHVARFGGHMRDSVEPDSPATSVRSDLLSTLPPPGAEFSRRGITPTKGRPPKPGKKAARVKHSPLKKKNGVVAGLPPAGGARNSPIGHGNPDGDEKNSDDCAACSGTGTLLMCDGCDRSYHFTCAEPPRNEADGPPEGEWFCTVCQSLRAPAPPTTRGVFASLRIVADAKNPVAFHLPLELRNFYEGVKTGEDGEYEEPLPSKAKSRSVGYEIAPDPLRLKDKEKTVLCYSCGKSAIDGRSIIDCDFCNLHWHLDCVDPPMANPPRGRAVWKCPAHTDLDLIDVTLAGGKARKVRRARNARVVVSALQRGIKNKGNIEIEDDSSDNEDESALYRLPPLGVKLDFIDKIKQGRHLDQATLGSSGREQREAKKHLDPVDAKVLPVDTTKAQTVEELFKQRSLQEREASLNLIRLFEANANAAFSHDAVENLIGTLIAEAPTEVVSSLSQESPVASDVGRAGANERFTAVDRIANPTAKIAATNHVNHSTNQVQSAQPLEPCRAPVSKEQQLEAYIKLEAVLKAKIASLSTARNGSRCPVPSPSLSELA